MLRSVLLTFSALVWLVLSVPGNGHADTSLCTSYDTPEVKRVVSFVHDAVQLLEEKGEGAFEDFSTHGSRWYSGDRYLFALDMEGTMVLDPPFPNLIGTNAANFRDLSGKLTIQLMLDQVKFFGRIDGWVHYLWPQPGEVNPRWKSSYVHQAETPSGQRYLVGSGLYEAPMERCFALQQVQDAATYLKHHGKAGFDYLRSRTGPFIWKSVYVFVMDEDNRMVVNPGKPEMEGKPARKWDARGVPFVGGLSDVSSVNEPEWLEYWWPKPGHLAASLKATYIMPITLDGKKYIIGCGVYLD